MLETCSILIFMYHSRPVESAAKGSVKPQHTSQECRPHGEKTRQCRGVHRMASSCMTSSGMLSGRVGGEASTASGTTGISRQNKTRQVSEQTVCVEMDAVPAASMKILLLLTLLLPSGRPHVCPGIPGLTEHSYYYRCIILFRIRIRNSFIALVFTNKKCFWEIVA